MRPIYETAETLESETFIAKQLGILWECELIKLPIKYQLDFVARRNQAAVGWCEIKTRKYTMKKIGEMGGYLLSLEKWKAARELCAVSGLPFTLVVQTIDGVWWHKPIFTQNFPIWVAGRTDRQDWQDVEPCVVLNVGLFKKNSVLFK